MNGSKKTIKEKRRFLFDICGGKCPECGREMSLTNHRAKNSYMTIDHIVPKSKGGTNNIQNLRALCRSCNIKRGSDMSNVKYYINGRNEYVAKIEK